MSKISVIIPVFNVELYLSKCLDSIINQTYKNLEIICINDGSTDNSLSILKEYKEKDNRIVIIEQQNSGPSISRNKGIDTASGDYIYFMDSDDWIDLDFFEKLYNTSIKEDADVVSVNAKNYIQEKGIYTNDTFFLNIDFNLINYKGYYTDLDQKLNTFITNYHMGTWKHFYRINLIKNNNIRFPEELKRVVDQPFNFACLFYANKLVVENRDSPYYYYRIRGNSLSTGNYSNKHIYFVLAFGKILNFCKENNYKINKLLKHYFLKVLNFEFINSKDKKEFFDYVVFYLSEFFTIEELEKIKEIKEIKEIKVKNNKIYIKLFSLIKIITIKKKKEKSKILLFGFLPILTIKSKEEKNE